MGRVLVIAGAGGTGVNVGMTAVIAGSGVGMFGEGVGTVASAAGLVTGVGMLVGSEGRDGALMGVGAGVAVVGGVASAYSSLTS